MSATDKDDQPKFFALKNSQLACADCVFKEEDDCSVFACYAYPEGKPSAVLDGADCAKHLTKEEALTQYEKSVKKREYLTKTFSRTTRKDYENYVIGAIWHRLNDLEIKPVTQQYVQGEGGRYFLIDLYFPQINLGVECDEKYHKSNQQNDTQRTLSMDQKLSALPLKKKFELLRIDADVGIEMLNLQIDQVIKRIQEVYKAYGSPKWSDEADAVEYVRSVGAISNDEVLYFSTISEVAACFGKQYKAMQRCTFFVDEKTMVWCPKLAICDEQGAHAASAAGWVNLLSEDWLTITEILPDGARHAKGALSPEVRRVVFAKSKNALGVSAYRFLGVYVLESIEDGRVTYRQADTIYTL